MRTTLNLDEDVLLAIRSLANASGRSLGSVVSELLRKSLEPTPYQGDDLPRFIVSPDSQIITPEMIQDALEEEW